VAGEPGFGDRFARIMGCGPGTIRECEEGIDESAGKEALGAGLREDAWNIGQEAEADVLGIEAGFEGKFGEGVEGGKVYAARNGYKIKVVVADTQTNPSAVLSAAQKLVTQDHVDAVIAHSALAFAAAPYLTAKGIPVVGVAEDGPEWQTAKNMFSVWGAIHFDKVSTTTGNLFKLLGASPVGALGYGISPSSAQAAKATGVSAQAVGLPVGYINSNFAFGSTNVAPIALAMKNANVQGLTTATDPNRSQSGRATFPTSCSSSGRTTGRCFLIRSA